MHPTLLVLAAGMGSRYGGLKQIDPVGPSGESLLDYSVFDAVRAGFGRVVFVIRPDFEAVFRDQVGAKYAGRVPVDYAFQTVDALPSGIAPLAAREKPWGTGHATWCARARVNQPFAVINADDFYGADSFQQLARFLAQGRSNQAALVGFRLANTLSEHGAVSRGICEAGPDGRLRSVVEHTSILRDQVGSGQRLTGEEITSMNCWGFTPDIFPLLEAQFRTFLHPLLQAEGEAVPGDALKREFYLPAAISTLIGLGELSVHVLPTECNWFGVTYREDKPRVAAELATLITQGRYPSSLF